MGTATAAAKAPQTSAAQQKAIDGKALTQHAPLLPSNRALLRLQRQCSCGGTCEECKKSSQNIQRLSISPVNDPLEREADRVADKVMRQPAAPVSVSAAPAVVSSAPNLTPQAEAQVNSVLASPGRPLDTGLRTDMEGRFGADFGGVRIHTDAAASESARSVDAVAYTVGHNIVYGSTADVSTSPTGTRLLAHELAHVVQQGSAPRALQRTNDSSAGVSETGQPSDGVGAGASATPHSVSLAVTHEFRVAAVSFLSCAGCNPFTDDGNNGVAPPSTEPSSKYRQKHFFDVSVSTLDGRKISSSAIRSQGNDVTVSHYCGQGRKAVILSYTTSGIQRITDPHHGEGVVLESQMGSRVGVSVPATLPGAPCGPLGNNSGVPPIGNSFKMWLFADGTRGSEFVSGSLYPSHNLYENRTLKTFSGAPVHPRINFAEWATSVFPFNLTAAEIGLRALRFSCCHPVLSHVYCPTFCSGGDDGRSVVDVFSLTDLSYCAAYGLTLNKTGCPPACGDMGSTCTPLSGPANP